MTGHWLKSFTVASKCGFDVFADRRVTNSRAHITEYIQGTTERLGFAPDLYYLHRIDPSENVRLYCLTCTDSTYQKHRSKSPSRRLTRSAKPARPSSSACQNVQPPL
jgi:aryl-alcohol dehydrogenase-like predicted oxidoreductase